VDGEADDGGGGGVAGGVVGLGGPGVRAVARGGDGPGVGVGRGEGGAHQGYAIVELDLGDADIGGGRREGRCGRYGRGGGREDAGVGREMGSDGGWAAMLTMRLTMAEVVLLPAAS